MSTGSLFPVLCELLLKSAVVLVLAGLASGLWRHASAASRHMVWALALAALLVLPLTKLAAPLWTMELGVTAAARMAAPMAALPATDTTVVPAALQETPAAKTWSLPPWRCSLVCAWMLGAVALLGYRGLGSLRLRWLRRHSEPLADQRTQMLARSVAAECGLADTVELRRTAVCRVPLAWGVWRPVVLLPDAALAWPAQRLAAALRHEFGHLRRRDCLVRLVSQLACALYWMNPLVWLAARRLRLAQEQACDDLVLRSGASAPDYADLLVQVVRGCGANRLFRRHALAMAQPSTLEARVQAIVDERRNRGPLGRGALTAGAAVAAALVAASALAQAQEKADAKEPKQQIMVEAKIIELPASQVMAFLPDGRGKSALFDPSETKGIVRKIFTMKKADMLSAPRVTTFSGQQAEIAVGREIRIGNEGAKKVFDGIKLDVQPKLQKDGLIHLTATLTVRDRLPNAQEPLTEQSFRERNMTTTVTLASGHTLAVGGTQDDAKGRTLLLLLTASLVNDASDKMPAAKPGALEEKARRIVVPRMEFVEAPLASVVEFLASKSRELDPEKKGVNIVIHAPPQAQAAKVTLNLRDIPLLDAIRYVAGIAGLKMTAAETVLVLGLPQASVAAPPRPAASAGSTAEKAKRMVVPHMEFREARVHDAVAFLAAQSRKLDPDKKGVNILLQIPPDAKLPVITLDLRDIPLLEALDFVARLADLQLTVDEHALRLELKRVK